MVEFADGSVKAHLGATDMRIPIQYALSLPDRWPAPAPTGRLHDARTPRLRTADIETFGCLALAFEAGRAGGTSPAVLNAANEVAVAAFLAGRCGFLDIERVVSDTLTHHGSEPLESVDQVLARDAEARATAEELLGRY